MIRENRQLVTTEPVEVQECRKITDHLIGIYRIYPNLIKEYRRMSACNRFDLQTLGSQSVMPKNLPDHCTNSSGEVEVKEGWIHTPFDCVFPGADEQTKMVDAIGSNYCFDSQPIF